MEYCSKHTDIEIIFRYNKTKDETTKYCKACVGVPEKTNISKDVIENKKICNENYLDDTKLNKISSVDDLKDVKCEYHPDAKLTLFKNKSTNKTYMWCTSCKKKTGPEVSTPKEMKTTHSDNIKREYKQIDLEETQHNPSTQFNQPDKNDTELTDGSSDDS